MVQQTSAETLAALMRQLRLDDPEAYQAVVCLMERQLARRVEKKSTQDLTGDDG